MKKNIFLMTALLSMGLFHAQIQVNNGSNSGITGSNVMIDGSTYFSTASGAKADVGKGIVIPSVDLVNFEFDLTLADGVTFPTYFDGMIVYNNATGNTLTTGNRASASLAVVPGFYYFSNPDGATNGNVTGGQWKPVGNTNPGDNLGNHSATQDLAMNFKELRLAGPTNNFHSLVYNSTVDGPYLKGNAGGALGNANGSTALQWDNTGKITLPNVTSRLQFANNVANKKIVLWEDAANDHQYYGLGINGSLMRYQVAGVGASHVFYAGTSATTSNEVFRISGNGDTSAAGNIFAGGQIYSGTNQWFRVRGINSGIYWENQGGGWWMTDTTWLRVYNNKAIMANNVIRSGTEGIGYAQLAPGGPSNTGYLAIMRANNTRLGFIGSDNNNMAYIAENGASHVFNGGNVVAETEVYSGVNRWFRVRGNTGVYWENHGGGWYMDDSAWLKSYNSKGILTGGSILAGSGQGYIQLLPGGASNTGHVAIHRANGTRLGYIGYDNNNLTYVSENGARHGFLGGFVGIATAAPDVQLSIAQNGAAYSFKIGDPGTNANSIQMSNRYIDFLNPSGGVAANINYQAFNNTFNINGTPSATNTVINGQTGNVFIGTANDNRGKLVVIGTQANIFGPYGYLAANGTAGYSSANNQANGIFASNSIGTGQEFHAYSDARIKQSTGTVDAENSLNTVKNLYIQKYIYKDKVRNGGKEKTGIFAQDLEKVFPEAVNKVTEFIPDVYAKSKVTNGNTVQIKSSDINIGDLIKIIVRENNTEQEYQVKITAKDGDAYTVDRSIHAGEVFIYGKQVNDFREVDYDRLTILSLSAIQALQEEIKSLKDEIKELKK